MSCTSARSAIRIAVMGDLISMGFAQDGQGTPVQYLRQSFVRRPQVKTLNVAPPGLLRVLLTNPHSAATSLPRAYPDLEHLVMKNDYKCRGATHCL